ncbi:hypothetical protein TRIATDRAFT_296719 [Trichoderma atroviride IMI 206040]|uniref:Uncharacterized protein n=1 Tax=Hypocrea atroviridis (strain ATCC 20476 / IMI 206040) TaxID=452589 RepID=G9PBH4_HYPAI|nr:uncharacterized protein TRIATDRAFT_296719 [Trichoderma atroviride IMI 206040]EHK39718.1 hypothetical protein TRIATDRAFT_296719 [Trichoderma atroviride IMI 206040]
MGKKKLIQFHTTLKHLINQKLPVKANSNAVTLSTNKFPSELCRAHPYSSDRLSSLQAFSLSLLTSHLVVSVALSTALAVDRKRSIGAPVFALLRVGRYL